jgi:GNAT superfamily N-acetyltransferase
MDPDEQRAFAFARWVDEQMCTRITPWTYGTLFEDAEFPEVADTNFLRVDAVPPDVEPGDVVAEAERARLEAGLAPRRLVVTERELADRLRPALADAGWVGERYLLMVQQRALEVPSKDAGEVSLDELVGLRAALEVETAGEIRIDPAYAEKVDRALGTRCFIATIDGEPASGCVLWVHGTDAQIDAVATRPSARRKGAAAAAIAAATAAARRSGITWIHLYTLADTGPVELYRRLGFDEVGSIVDFSG